MIVGAPITTYGGTIRRLRLWLGNIPDGCEVLFLYSSVSAEEDLFPDLNKFSHARTIRSGFLGKWVRALILPAVVTVCMHIYKYKPSVVVSFFPWAMIAAGAATRIARMSGLKVRHVIHLAGDPLPPVEANWRKQVYRACLG